MHNVPPFRTPLFTDEEQSMQVFIVLIATIIVLVPMSPITERSLDELAWAGLPTVLWLAWVLGMGSIKGKLDDAIKLLFQTLVNTVIGLIPIAILLGILFFMGVWFADTFLFAFGISPLVGRWATSLQNYVNEAPNRRIDKQRTALRELFHLHRLPPTENITPLLEAKLGSGIDPFVLERTLTERFVAGDLERDEYVDRMRGLLNLKTR
ncbi:MAG: hypothetical protein AAGD38_21480 [Acidobacteriota bacterium]